MKTITGTDGKEYLVEPLRVEKVHARDVFKDDNHGLVFGLQEVDMGNYVEWFATEEEREANIKKYVMEVMN